MEGLTSFFGLGSDATETEIHNALDGQKALAEQLEEARNLAVEKSIADMEAIKERLTSLEEAQSAMKAEIEAKDVRIAEMQVQISEHEAAAETAQKAGEAMKVQHQKEINNLAGQVSALKAGRKLEQDEGGEEHAIEHTQKESGPQVIAIKSSTLAELVKKRQN